jgi:4-hydroxy-tetrahydrodipicolinate synthase
MRKKHPEGQQSLADWVLIRGGRMSNHRITGVFSAAATPLNADDGSRILVFSRPIAGASDEGCHGVALLGTTGEANSFSSSERRGILEAALKAGIPADQLLPGTGVAAIPETSS